MPIMLKRSKKFNKIKKIRTISINKIRLKMPSYSLMILIIKVRILVVMRKLLDGIVLGQPLLKISSKSTQEDSVYLSKRMLFAQYPPKH